MNSALAALLRGNNTTISIAHRLSTIKRSDTIIVLGPDGRVAEQGSYQELSSRPDGAFTKLMEWQMSGGDMPQHPLVAQKGPPTYEEQLEQLHQEEHEVDAEEEEEVKDQSEFKAHKQG